MQEGGEISPHIDLETPHTHVHRLSRRLLEPAQDLLVLGIGLSLFGLMGRTLIWLFHEIVKGGNLDFRGIIDQVLFKLVMVELVRLGISYVRATRMAGGL